MPTQPRPIVVHRGPGGNVAFDTLAGARDWTVVAYVDHDGPDRSADVGGVPVVSFTTWREQMHDVPSVVAALDPAVRQAIVARVSAGGGSFATVRPTGRAISPQATFGEGALVGDGPLYVGSLTAVGSHTIVMIPASIGHDCVIGDFVTIYPSAAISGYVVIEDRVTIGAGAVIANGAAAKPLRVGCAAHVAAGAAVTKSVAAGASVAGNPGRTFRPSR
jgi:UDP-3-O-[3-hydroxymyristoyl] glucosamine N-acyltransferase